MKHRDPRSDQCSVCDTDRQVDMGQGSREASFSSTAPARTAKPEGEYFLFRAEAELEAAQGASHPKAVEAHYVLAAHYLDRVYGPGGGSSDD